MALLDALGSRLQTSGVGTLGTNIFLTQFQDTPDTAVCVFERQGFDPMHTFGAGVTYGDRPLIRVLCRGPRNDYPTARAKAEAVRASLGVVRNLTVSGITITCVLDATGIYSMGFDKEERPILGIDFTAWVQP